MPGQAPASLDGTEPVEEAVEHDLHLQAGEGSTKQWSMPLPKLSGGDSRRPTSRRSGSVNRAGSRLVAQTSCQIQPSRSVPPQPPRKTGLHGQQCRATAPVTRPSNQAPTPPSPAPKRGPAVAVPPQPMVLAEVLGDPVGCIGRWLLKHGSAPWPSPAPTGIVVEPLEGNRFDSGPQS